MATRFKVEHRYTYGWDDAGWTLGDQPWRFKTKEEAQAEVSDFVTASAEEGLDYELEDFRVVEAND